MFKKSIKMKFRFQSVRGQLTTEDLWDLPLTSSDGLSLDAIAQSLNKEIKATSDESFVKKSSPHIAILKEKLELVKEVIADTMADEQQARTNASNRLLKKKLLALQADVQDQTLKGKTAEELQEMIDELD
jgi:hypothetical protein